jgi:hypothetical protein
MATIDESPYPLYMHDADEDTWYSVGGRVSTGANYQWNGAHQFNNLFKVTDIAQITKGFNSYVTTTDRNAAMPNPTQGLLSYVLRDAATNVIDRFEYYDGYDAEDWKPLIRLDTVYTGDTQYLTNKTIWAPDFDGGPLVYVGSVDFSTNDEYLPPNYASLTWSDGLFTFVGGVGPNGVQLNVGQQILHTVINNSGSNIYKGDVVTVISSDGSNLTVAAVTAQVYTEGLGDLSPETVLGLAYEDIADGFLGTVISYGEVMPFDTGAYLEGEAVWLSAATPGKLTSIRPADPNQQVFVGWCVRQDYLVGSIFVDIKHGSALNDLYNVSITAPVDRNILSFSGNKWINKPILAAILEVDGAGSGIDADLLDGQQGAWYAPINSPTLTGVPRAPTPTVGDSSTKIATTEFVMENSGSGTILVAIDPQDGNYLLGVSVLM